MFRFSKKDLYLIGGVFGVIITLIIISLIMYNSKEPGSKVEITLDGKLYKEVVLTEDKEIRIENEYGINNIIIKNGKVYVDYADCPDKVCVNHLPIFKEDEQIICIPHKLIIRIVR